MPWVRGHYARRPRTGRWSGPSAGVIVLIALGVILVIYLITR